jgi:hypothetical protein
MHMHACTFWASSVPVVLQPGQVALLALRGRFCRICCRINTAVALGKGMAAGRLWHELVHIFPTGLCAGMAHVTTFILVCGSQTLADTLTAASAAVPQAGHRQVRCEQHR